MNRSFVRRFVILRHDVPDDSVERVAAARDAAARNAAARNARPTRASRDAGAESSVVPGSFLSASHWDWMFEPWGLARGEATMLWTWATPTILSRTPDERVTADPHAVSAAKDPTSGPLGSPLERTFESDAVRLADHRPAYLDYEGPVSRGRGDVTRVLSGTYATLGPKPQRDPTGAGEHEASPGPTTTMRLAWFDPRSGHQRIGRLALQRRWDVLSDDDPARAVWRLRFSPIW